MSSTMDSDPGGSPEPYPGLMLTGERTLPGIWHEGYWFARHQAAYSWLAPQVAAGIVLEAGCGEGYGAALLLDAGASTVVGLDYDEATVAHVHRCYPRVQVVQANLVALPLPDESVDAVVSLQTVEHLWDQPGFVAECVRVLRPGGRLAVSTPNRLTFSPGVGRGGKPLNPFHVNEFDAEELVDLLAEHCAVDGVFTTHHGPRIELWERVHGSLVDAQLAVSYGEWDAELSGLVASLTREDFVVRRDSVDKSLDLVVLGRAR